jgi:chemotaxis protein histidine kinase CheA
MPGEVMAFDHTKFLARFADEAREHCSKLSDGLIALEKSPGEPEIMNAIFRSAHTLKGSARMMKLNGVSDLAHCMEDVLDAARNGKLAMTREISDLLFNGLDELTTMLERISSGGKHEAAGHLLGQLRAVASGELADGGAHRAAGQPEVALLPHGEADLPQVGAQADRTAEPPAADKPVESLQEASTPEVLPPGSGAPSGGHQAEYLRVNASKLDDLVRLMGEILSEHSRLKRDAQLLRTIERRARRHAMEAERLLDERRDAQDSPAGIPDSAAALAASLRKSVASLNEGLAMQDHLMAELQDTSLKLRMLPLSTVFEPLRRTVRDLSREFGKEIDFVIQGGDTELDRKIAERIGDSLLHLIRNALDHGLESAEERVCAGKPARGNISLSAFYDSGGVTIALSDDGRGLATEKIREKALAKHLFDAETLGRMSRAEVNNLIFLPGFSTSRIITDISGRGVGMDVVRKSIVDELKGAVIIDTHEGQGATFLLRLPLNLAVFPLFLVCAGRSVCALPATYIVEMLLVEREEIIEIVNKRAIRLREQIVPVEDLGTILRLNRDGAQQSAKATIVVVRDGENKLGLLVDEILGREERVVKPLPAHLKNLTLVTGGTLGEGGGIVNVLHVPELMRMARDLAGEGRKAPAPKEERGVRILVVDDSINTREIEKSILEAYGYTVDTAEDGQEALEMTRDDLYDLVITDLEMPRLDGFSLTEKLRSDPRYRHVPVVIVTSLEKDEDKKRGIVVGADAYIVKRAFDQSNLLDTVKSLIG